MTINKIHIKIIIAIIIASIVSYRIIYDTFECTVIVNNHMMDYHNLEIIPLIADYKIVFNSDTLITGALESNILRSTFKHEIKLKFGYNFIEVYSDSMNSYDIQKIFIFYPRDIFVGMGSSYSSKHMSIGIY